MNTEVDEKVRKFYKLKEQYENERRATRDKSKQIRCISCRRLVGSTFKQIANADGTRNLFAVCGDSITPCKLNLNIHLGATVNNEDEMILYKKKISELKKNIILGKNNLLFGYVSRENALENFNKLKEDLTRETDIYEKELQLYTNTVNNLDKITKTIETQNKITDTVADFQNLIRQYVKTSEPSFINDSIDLYIKTLLPELYAYKELTIPLSAKDFEMNYDDPRVISDEFGPVISHKISTRKRKVTTKKTVTQKTRDWPESPKDSPPEETRGRPESPKDSPPEETRGRPESPKDSPPQETRYWPNSPEDSPPSETMGRRPSSPKDSPPSETNYNTTGKTLIMESDMFGATPLPRPPKSANPTAPTTIVQHIYSPTPVSMPLSSKSSYFTPPSSPKSYSYSSPPSSEPTTTTDELIEFDGPSVSNLEGNSYDLNPHD